MSYKLKFDTEAGTCTSIIMYPSHSARALLKHLQSKGLRCEMHFRGEDEGCTIHLHDAPWRDVVAGVEEFLRRPLFAGPPPQKPPASLYVSTARAD